MADQALCYLFMARWVLMKSPKLAKDLLVAGYMLGHRPDWRRRTHRKTENWEWSRAGQPTATKRIGVMGFFGYGNLGDEALQDAVLQNLGMRLDDVEFVGFSLDPADTEARHGIRSFPLSRTVDIDDDAEQQRPSVRLARRLGTSRIGAVRRLDRWVVRIPLEFGLIAQAFRQVGDLDALIVSGSGPLNDYWGGGGALSFPYTLAKWGAIARLRRVPFLVVSVGAGPIHSRLSAAFIRSALRCATYRSYRDEFSKQLVSDDGFGADDLVTPDLAHSLPDDGSSAVVTMATAIEAGVVSPEDRFDTFNGGFSTGGHRIREALGAPVGVISASDAIVGSSNAVMAQIGMLVDDAVFHDSLDALGYGRRPGAGLGHERAGRLAPLGWKLDWTHASISFGHEILVTFWQHTNALVTIVRGGEVLPLRLLSSVEQNGVRHGIAPAEPVRVFSERTCASVRRMMQLGAQVGTGRDHACEGIVMGTKTGTAEKVPDEVCLHVELQHQVEPHMCGRDCRRALKGRRDAHRRSCYTSSMVVFGRLEDEEREVLVFVVVDEPRGRAKFGADVAGDAAVEILSRALDLPRRAQADGARMDDGFEAMGAVSTGSVEQPWAERSGGEGSW